MRVKSLFLYLCRKIDADTEIVDLLEYSEQELESLLGDESKPIFVYDDGEVLGYAFCRMVEVSDERLAYQKTI